MGVSSQPSMGGGGGGSGGMLPQEKFHIVQFEGI